MRYSQEQVWNCVYDFIPKLKTVRDNGISLNLPSVLRDVAVEVFMQCNSVEYKTNYKLQCSAFTIQVALKELRDNGQMTFLDNEE